MITFGKLSAAVAVALTLASAPALAKSHAGRAARAQAIEDVISQEGVSLERAQALRACNVIAAPFGNYTWGVTQSDVYRNCMTQHGQAE